MSKSSSLFNYAAAAVAAYFGQYQLAASFLMAGAQSEKARRARNQARDAYNASLKDRMVMADLQPSAPRTLVLGRVRAVEGIRRRWVSGTHNEQLTLVVSFAGHQIDAFETFWANDVALTLDAQGWVQTAPYLKTSAEPEYASGTLDGAGAASLTLGSTPIDGTVTAVSTTGTGSSMTQVQLTVGGSGASITLSGGEPSAVYQVTWQTTVGSSLMRIRPYLGAPGQNIGAALAAEYPGKITATDKFEGMAAAVIDLFFDPDVYPQGWPNITATMRGALCLDPRDNSTAWTENPALHAYHYARWASGWAVPADEIRSADVQAAATVCAESVSFTLGGTPTTLPRYRCGIVISSDAEPRQSMNDIMQTMAGRWGWAGGTWRMRAGAMAAPVFALDASWPAQRVQPGGTVTDEPVVRITNGVPRDEQVNSIGGRCIDPAQRYQLLPYPTVQDAVLIAAKGLYPREVDWPGVNHIAHAQHLASIDIREAQAPLRMEVQSNLSAYRCELFDVGTVTLPRYGMSGKTVEVTGWRWAPSTGVQLKLAEITAAIFEPVASLTGRDPAPNSTLPRPTDVEQITGLAVTSGTEALTDASVITRTRVAWTAPTSQAVRVGGHVEVQYTLAADALPTGDWASWPEPGDSAAAVLPGLLAGRFYLFRARAINALGVRGPWSVQVLHQVAQPPASSVSLLELQATSVGFAFADSSATTPITPDIVFTAVLQGVAGTVTFSGTAYSAAHAVVGAPGDVTFTSLTATSATLTGANFARGGTAVRYVRVTATLGALSDVTTIHRGDDGTDAVLVVLSNEAHTLPAANDGTVSSYAGSGTTIRVFEGIVELDYDGVGAAAGKWTVSSSASNITRGTLTDSGLMLTVGAHSAMTADAATITYTVSGKTSSGAAFSQAPVQSFSKSKAGATGANGTRTATLRMYRWSVSTPVTFPAGTSTYTWATGTFTAPATTNGWALTPGAAVAGQTLWACDQRYSDELTTATSTVTWATSTAFAAGAAGTDGAAGSAGAAGATATYAYQIVSSATLPAAPAVPSGAPTAGNASTPGVWYALPPSGGLSTGQWLFQASGTLSGSTYVWVSPSYLATFRVGNLAALSADIDGTQSTSVYDPLTAGTVSRSVALRVNSSLGAQIGVFARGATASVGAVYGYNSDGSGIGVMGYSSTGVYGHGSSVGVQGTAGGFGAFGVLGSVIAGTGGTGVQGWTSISADASVAIRATALNAANIALQVVGFTSVSGQISSSLTTGTAPISVTSTTECTNLNAALLKGATWSAPGAIGSTTPGTVRCTTLRVDTEPVANNGGGAITNSNAPSGNAGGAVVWLPVNYNGTNYIVAALPA